MANESNHLGPRSWVLNVENPLISICVGFWVGGITMMGDNEWELGKTLTYFDDI